MFRLLLLAESRFVSLTTFRRLVGSGKVKRLRHDPRVEIRPCGRFGKVAEGSPAVGGIAELRDGAAHAADHLTGRIGPDLLI